VQAAGRILAPVIVTVEALGVADDAEVGALARTAIAQIDVQTPFGAESGGFLGTFRAERADAIPGRPAAGRPCTREQTGRCFIGSRRYRAKQQETQQGGDRSHLDVLR
jgi:hypothetical protein